MTGADSPVIADSSTEAMPSTISPSEGIISPATTTTTSSTVSSDDGTALVVPSSPRRLAMVAVRAWRSVAAWALPRPSATASAKLANSTVNHSHAATSPANRFSFPVDEPRSRKKMNVVSRLPSHTTNMTGLRTIRRGCSLRRLSRAAVLMICGSNNDRALVVATDAPYRPSCSTMGPSERTGK
jgi:hypothetical protein